ncbi:hypothetical protein N9R79_03550 [Vibrio sp.]|nr:hypothetical protein [Vibrio sp.]
MLDSESAVLGSAALDNIDLDNLNLGNKDNHAEKSTLPESVHRSIDSIVSHTQTQTQTQVQKMPARFGRICSVDSRSTVQVIYDGHSVTTTVTAKLGRLFTKAELDMAINSELACRVEFEDNNVTQPIVTNIYFSILEEEQALTLRAKTICIQADEKLILKSGNATSELISRGGRIKSSAKYITSQAEMTNSIEGGSIALN